MSHALPRDDRDRRNVTAARGKVAACAAVAMPIREPLVYSTAKEPLGYSAFDGLARLILYKLALLQLLIFNIIFFMEMVIVVSCYRLLRWLRILKIFGILSKERQNL